MGRTGASSKGLRKTALSAFGSVKKQSEKIYLRGKEELTRTQVGKPKWDESFFERAKKEERRGGVKY